MTHRQKLHPYRVLSKLISYSTSFKELNYILVLIINVILLLTLDKQGGKLVLTNQSYEMVFNGVNVLQLFSSVTVFLCCLIERLPLSTYRQLDTPKETLRPEQSKFRSFC